MFLFLLNLSFLAYSQSTERYINTTEENSGPTPGDFYKIMFEFKDFQITEDNFSILKSIDLKNLFAMKYQDHDVEIFLENIQKTIIIYSTAKAEELMETHYNHVANFVPLYK